MTKPQEKTPSAEFILGEWNNRSGFALEMRVMQALRWAGCECTHGLTYTDPKTKMDRQFDLRATRVRGNTCMRLAVECKELSPQCPLVFGRVPRDMTEAGHQLVVVIRRFKTGHSSALENRPPCGGYWVEESS